MSMEARKPSVGYLQAVHAFFDHLAPFFKSHEEGVGPGVRWTMATLWKEADCQPSYLSVSYADIASWPSCAIDRRTARDHIEVLENLGYVEAQREGGLPIGLYVHDPAQLVKARPLKADPQKQFFDPPADKTPIAPEEPPPTISLSGTTAQKSPTDESTTAFVDAIREALGETRFATWLTSARFEWQRPKLTCFVAQDMLAGLLRRRYLASMRAACHAVDPAAQVMIELDATLKTAEAERGTTAQKSPIERAQLTNQRSSENHVSGFSELTNEHTAPPAPAAARGAGEATGVRSIRRDVRGIREQPLKAQRLLRLAATIYDALADETTYPWVAISLAIARRKREVDRATLRTFLAECQSDGVANHVRQRFQHHKIPWRKRTAVRELAREEFGLAWRRAFETAEAGRQAESRQRGTRRRNRKPR